MSDLTKKLRSEFEFEAFGLAFRRARDGRGRRIYQLVGRTRAGGKIVRTLDAKSELDALDEARALMPTIHLPKTSRAPTIGRLRDVERLAMVEVEKRGSGRGATTRNQRAIQNTISWLQERGLPLTQANLVLRLQDTEQSTAPRRDSILACSVLARVAGLVFEVPTELKYKQPKPPVRTIITEDEIEEAIAVTSGKIPPEHHYILAAVAITGLRGNEVLSMSIPDDIIEVGTPIKYWCSKRARPGITTPSMDICELYLSDGPPGYLKPLQTPSDRPPDDSTHSEIARIINDVSNTVRRRIPEQYRHVLQFRQLRHQAGSRLLEMGVQPLQVAEVLGTSTRMLEQIYSDFFRAKSAQAIFTAYNRKKG